MTLTGLLMATSVTGLIVSTLALPRDPSQRFSYYTKTKMNYQLGASEESV
jgi:hypothetical protein